MKRKCTKIIDKGKVLFGLLLLAALSAVGQKPIDHVNMFIGSTGNHETEYGGTTAAR